MFGLIRPSRTLLGLCVIFICSSTILAQDPVLSAARKANDIAPVIRYPETRSTIEAPPSSQPRSRNNLTTPKSIQAFQYSVPSTSQRSTNVTCIDSSFLKIFEATNRAYSFSISAKTHDGGIVLGGFGRDKTLGPPYTWYGVITKFDAVGQHIWSKELRSDVLPPGLYIEGISVLSDGSIIVSGWQNNPLSTTPPTPTVDLFIAKLTSGGNLVWFKTFHSLMGNGCTTSNIRYVWSAEGANGDLYFGGTIPNCPDPRYLVVFKLNSAGDLQWKYNFTGHFTRSYCIGVFYDGNTVTVVNRGDGSSMNSISVDLVKLNAATGAYISHKSWEPDLAFPANFQAGLLNWTPTVVRLNNGNYCVYGNTFGDFFNPLGADQPHFTVLEFNTNCDFVKGYNINSTLVTNAYESRIKVDKFGKVIYGMSVQLAYPDEIKYYGIADNGVILHQRKKPVNGFENFYDNAELFDDGSVAYINNLATVGQSNFYLYYSLMHVTDTGSVCLGTIENYSHIVPVSYKPNSFAWTPPNPDPFIITSNQNNSVVPINYTESPPCFEKSVCDTLDIRGNTTLCDYQQDLTFTAFKNVLCGVRVNWSIDTAAIQSFQVINDTTVVIRFDQAWQGWLYATLQTSCGVIKDSVLLTITASPGAVNIGPDTSLCALSTLILNARRGYVNYLWHNGSTDSLITVTGPGTYYVTVTDACGVSFSDTVSISLAPPIALSVGPDRTKCNTDTIQLQAPPGFMNYSWSPNYNISAINTQQVIVSPVVDTTYTLIAEKTPGCFGYDTIRITVNTSPTIALGTDQSFCAGDSLLLDAGAGFSQYLWNNGSAAQGLTVNTAGSYSVIGTTAAGCRSFDTLIVLNVYPLPVVSLNKDSSLCTGDLKTLDAGNGFANYSWSTGNNSQSIIVNDLGVYSVIVTDNNGCKAGDTTRITTMFPKPSGFLGADTAICAYWGLQLKANANFDQYKWSTGSTASSINIRQTGIFWLQVKDDNGCFGKDSITIDPKDCGKGFFMPTGFTPNNDGKNDLLKPIILGDVVQYQFRIYNRWGELIFETTDVNKGWDGAYKGKFQSAGVFVWMCVYQFNGQVAKNEKGTVVLIR